MRGDGRATAAASRRRGRATRREGAPAKRGPTPGSVATASVTAVVAAGAAAAAGAWQRRRPRRRGPSPPPPHPTVGARRKPHGRDDAPTDGVGQPPAPRRCVPPTGATGATGATGSFRRRPAARVCRASSAHAAPRRSRPRGGAGGDTDLRRRRTVAARHVSSRAGGRAGVPHPPLLPTAAATTRPPPVGGAGGGSQSHVGDVRAPDAPCAWRLTGAASSQPPLRARGELVVAPPAVPSAATQRHRRSGRRPQRHLSLAAPAATGDAAAGRPSIRGRAGADDGHDRGIPAGQLIALAARLKSFSYYFQVL